MKNTQNMEAYASGSGNGRGSEVRDDIGLHWRDALRRNWPLIVLIVVPLTALVLAVSLILPSTYRATAMVSLTNAGVERAGGNPELVLRELETVERLATTGTTLARAAGQLGGESIGTLAEKVSASADAEANLVRISAEDGEAPGAARIANAVAGALLARRGAGLALVDPARPAASPDSPKPLQNTLFAFFGFAFIAILAALARERLSGRVRDAHELSALVGSPLLVEVPTRVQKGVVAGRPSPLPVYEPLRETVDSLLPAGFVRTMLVAGPGRDKAAADVASALAEAFAREGELVALVTDRTRTNGVEAPSVSEVVAAVESGSGAEALLAEAVTPTGVTVLAEDVDAQLASRRRLEDLLEALSDHDVGLVVVSGEPLLQSSDGLLLTGLVDGVVLVCMPERVTRDDAGRLHDVLRACGANVLGIVAIGGDRIVPYRAPSRAPAPRV